MHLTSHRVACQLNCTRFTQQKIGKNGQRVSPLDDSSYCLQDAKKFILRRFENDHVNPFMAYNNLIRCGPKKASAQTFDKKIN